MQLAIAIAEACQVEPALNAWLNSDEQTLQHHAHVDLGIAVDTDQGLFVPVLRDIKQQNPTDLEQALRQLKKDIQARRTPPADLTGATITLSNFGSLGGNFASMVVMPPQVAIIGAGHITSEAIVNKGNVVAHRVIPLSVTFDHRAVTGGEAARFMAALKQSLQAQTQGR